MGDFISAQKEAQAMSFESHLKQSYAYAHNRLINGGREKRDLVHQFPSASTPPKPSPPEIKPTVVIPNPSPITLEPPKPRYSLALLAEWLSGMELIGVLDIRSKQRTREIALSRMIFYHLAYKHSSGRFSSSQIGRYCRKDHTSVLAGIKTIAKKRKTDKQLDFRLQQYEKALIEQNMEVHGKPLCALCPLRHPLST